MVSIVVEYYGEASNLLFRARSSIVQTIMKVVDTVHRIETCSLRSRRALTSFTQEIGNALNFVGWARLSLADIDYLRDRSLLTNTLDNQRWVEITLTLIQAISIGADL